MRHRFYQEFAPYWPLISPVHEYEEEGNYFASLLRARIEANCAVLELGSGGGHCSYYLTKHFAMTLSDLSPEMLAISKRVNPSSEHICGDMRTLRLNQEFDAVFIHDAIDYMITREDLTAALTTAYLHCRPGGTCVIAPDHLKEHVELEADCGGHDGDDGRGVRFLEWTWDPDPSDDWVQTEYSFVFRAADGAITHAHESHRTAAFSEETWLAILRQVGFEPERVVEQTTEDRPPRIIFIGKRAGA